MLYPNLLVKELEAQRESFIVFDREWRDDVRDYARRMRLLDGQSSEEIRRVAELAKELGALPSSELERGGKMVVPFGLSWHSHEEARAWAVDVLHERVTFAADGSQLVPGREVSMPVAAVQVAWFENAHTRDGSYIKDARPYIISPGDLLEAAKGGLSAESYIGFCRFKKETEAVAEFLKKKKGWQERKERTPVAFFDGTLLISIALPKTKLQDDYIKAVRNLVLLSKETGVPVVGYVDQSYARDLVWLLDTLDRAAGGKRSRSLYDAQLLRVAVDEEPLLANWGDRTVFCYCQRKGATDYFNDDEGKPLIGFTYLQTTGESAPARLDVPAWVYEAGLLDDVVNAVRAECVGGLGYPYAIETADAAAYISGRDREQFLRAMQEFAEREAFSFRISRKAASKVRR
ncbi:MAG: DNA double-strand break repair nuclease NurA, partial [Pyrinomonadaceae bacterium]